MKFRSTHKFARISPQKVRPLATLIRGKYVDEALDILRYQPQRGARMLERVIRTALANAQDPDQNPGRIVDEQDLYLSEVWRSIQVRCSSEFGQAVAGRRFLIKKRMSHIRVGIEEI